MSDTQKLWTCRVCNGRRLLDGPSGDPQDATSCTECEVDELEQATVAEYHQLMRDGKAPVNLPSLPGDGNLVGRAGPLPEHGWD